jgi:hypothetical protein
MGYETTAASAAVTAPIAAASRTDSAWLLLPLTLSATLLLKIEVLPLLLALLLALLLLLAAFSAGSVRRWRR